MKGCIIKIDRLVIAESFHQRVNKQLHRGYPGMKRMKASVRSHVFIPDRGSTKILLLWPHIVSNPTTSAAIEFLNKLFVHLYGTVRYSIPNVIVSDNDTLFATLGWKNQRGEGHLWTDLDVHDYVNEGKVTKSTPRSTRAAYKMAEDFRRTIAVIRRVNQECALGRLAETEEAHP